MDWHLLINLLLKISCWNLINLQCCAHFRCTARWFRYRYRCFLKFFSIIVVVWLLRCALLFVTSWTAAFRLLCPSLSYRVCSDSCPSSQWCHPTISSSVAPLFSCLQSFPTSGSFPMSWLFASGGQSIGASGSASVLPMNIQGWFPLELMGWVSLQSKGLSRVFSNPTVQKPQFFSTQPFLMAQLIHLLTTLTWLLEKIYLHYVDLCWQSDVSALQ